MLTGAEIAWIGAGASIGLIAAKATADRLGSRWRVRLGGATWSRREFCRGWLGVGMPGSGKTSAYLNSVLRQLCAIEPWGGVVLDAKGDWWETAARELGRVGRASDLVVLRRGGDVRTNLLEGLGGSAMTTAAWLYEVLEGQGYVGRGNQPVFFESAKNALAESIDLLRLSATPLTPTALIETARTTKTVAPLPKDTRESVLATFRAGLRPLSEPWVEETFFSPQPTHKIEEIEDGRVFALSIPSEESQLRRLLMTLLKSHFYRTALARYDRYSSSERWQRRMLVAFADEYQSFVSRGDGALDDKQALAQIRDSCAALIAATQSFDSIEDRLGTRAGMNVLLGNLGSWVIFACPGTGPTAETCASRIGRKRQWVVSGRTKGVTSHSYHDDWIVTPSALKDLRPFEAWIVPASGGHRRCKLARIA